MKMSFGIRFQTIDGLLFMLTLWMDKVIEERENVQRIFEKLQFYVDNFKPITEIKPEHRDKMQRFLNQAYECHLKVKNERERRQEEEESRVFYDQSQILSHISIVIGGIKERFKWNFFCVFLCTNV